MATAAKQLVNYRIQVVATRGEQLVVERQYQASPNQWVTVAKYLTSNINILPKHRQSWMEEVPALFASCKVPRCIICDFPLAASADEGCVPGNCSYRPPFGSPDWYRIKERRERLEREALETVPVEEWPQPLQPVAPSAAPRAFDFDPNGSGPPYTPKRETPAETWQRITGQPWPGGTSGAVVALLKFFSIPCRPGSGEANVWLQNIMLRGVTDFTCPNCSSVKLGVCTHPWHWGNAVVPAACPDCGSATPEGFISIDSTGRSECQHKFHNPYNLTPEQILPSTY